MKWTFVFLLVCAAVVVTFAACRGTDTLLAGFRSSGSQFVQFFPFLLFAFLLMGFLDVLVPKDMAQQWLSDASGMKGLLVAWLAGILTPGGSIIGLPLAAGLLKSGASPSILITYLTSLATLSVMRAPIEIGFYGVRLTVLRVVACLVVPLVAGVIARAATPIFFGPSA